MTATDTDDCGLHLCTRCRYWCREWPYRDAVGIPIGHPSDKCTLCEPRTWQSPVTGEWHSGPYRDCIMFNDRGQCPDWALASLLRRAWNRVRVVLGF